MNDKSLTAAEQAAFEKLIRSVGFAPQVVFGRDVGALRWPPATMYALSRESESGGVQEYRLLLVTGALAAAPPAAENGTTVERKRYKRHGRVVYARGTDAYMRRMRRAQKKAWEARKKKYGPKGFKPGQEPWKHASEVRTAKLAAKQPEPPEKSIRPF